MDRSGRNPSVHSRHEANLIPYGRHSIDDEDINSVVQALRSDWLTTGPLVEQFESKLKDFLGAPTITVSSGTAALHAAYSAIGLKPGDEIITPPITFIATQATAALLGAKVLFADICPKTGNLDPQKVLPLINSKTRAIVTVDFAGRPSYLKELKEIADKHQLYLIEDASHSFGSEYHGQMVGGIADITTFSFFPTKNMTTAEGGAISSHNPELLERARLFSRQGIIRDSSIFHSKNPEPWHYEVQEFGLNYRLPDVMCALGISQLRRINDFKKRRMEIFNYYSSRLENLAFLQIPIPAENCSPNWHFYPIQVNQEFRNRMYLYLREKGIAAQINYIPAYRHPVFRLTESDFAGFPMSEKFYSCELSLPMYFGLTNADLEKIVDAITEFPT
jgi:dTDP-4-amino-4,6-dideoxygalactose transaminase